MHRRVLAGVVCVLAWTWAAGQQNSPVEQRSAASDAALSAPLPDIQALLTRVTARNHALETLRKSYICTMTQVADEFSTDGSKKTHTDQYQVFYVANTAVFQHISRDGKPLSTEDARKEQERVDKQVAKLKSGGNKRDKDEFRLSNALKDATFSDAHREVVNGRATLVFDYKGDPHAKAENLGQEIMRHLAGKLWVDEQDDAIVRFTGSLDENFRVGGGLLVNIRKGSWLDLTQSRINGEIWFPAEFTAHVDGRFLLVKGFDGDMRQTFSEYRKMKTSVTILPGTRVLEEGSPDGPARPEPDSNSAEHPASAPKP